MDWGSGSGRWLLAGILSLGLHVALLYGLVTLGKSDSPSEDAVVPPPTTTETSPAPAETTGSGEPDYAAKEPERVKPAETVPSPKPKRKTTRKSATKPVEQKPSETKHAEAKPQEAKPAEPSRPEVETVTYVVKPGDTLTALTKQHDMTASELARLNGVSISQLSKLRVGQKIKVPK